MATGQMGTVLSCLRRTLVGEGEQRSDGQLLERFITLGEEVAFEALVRRHGAMVLGVCRRVLGNVHDGDDAFQATFLVLVRKARSVAPREAVGNWLYGVAYRTALEARARILRRAKRERHLPDMPHPITEPPRHWNDVAPLLDRELSRLPEKYRLPVVLCDLEGRGRPEVSDHLHLAPGTLSSRLARGRKMLADRLRRKGLVLSAGALALALSRQSAAAVPASLSLSTVQAAALLATGQAATGVVSAQVIELMQGVLKAMSMTKIQNILGALCVAVFLGTGAALFTHGSPPERALAEPPAKPLPARVRAFAPALVAEKDALLPDAFVAAFGERERPRTPPALNGKVVAVAKDGKSFTVETPAMARGDEPARQEFKIDDKTTLTFSGVGPDGAKLAEGFRALVWLVEGSKDVAANVTLMGTAGPRRTSDLSGRVTAVSKDGATLTFDIPAKERGGEGTSFTVRITDRTTLLYSFVPKDGTKPTAGYFAEVWLQRGSKDVADRVNFGGTEGRPDRELFSKKVDVMGKVKSASKDGKSVIIESPPRERGEEAEQREIKLDDKSRVYYMQVPPEGVNPKAGYQVRAWLVEGSKDKVDQVVFQAPFEERQTILRGRVVAIAKGGKGITLEMPPTERGAEAKRVDILLTDKTAVAYEGVGAGGARLTEGYFAQVWLMDGSTDTADQVLLGAEGRGRR